MYIIGWFIGIFTGSFFVVQPLIILFFSIPFTLKLIRTGALINNSRFITRDFASIIVQVILFFLIRWILSLFNDNILIGFYIGIGITLLLGLGKIFGNANNKADYIENNIRVLHPDFVEEYVNNLVINAPKTQSLEKHLRFIHDHKVEDKL
jgi:hypothetical protein